MGKEKQQPFIWCADYVLHRGPVDGPMLMHAEVSAVLHGGDGPGTRELMHNNAVTWLSEQLPADPADLSFSSACK